MADYKVVLRKDLSKHEILWEPGCPLIFEAIQVSRNIKSGETFLQGKVLDISDTPIDSFKASIDVVYGNGDIESVQIDRLDADISQGASLLLEPVKLQQSDAIKFSERILSASSAGHEWASKGEPGLVPEPVVLGLSSKAKEERYQQLFSSCKGTREDLEKAAGNGLVQEDGWWECPCGTPNVGRATCASCGASLDALSEKDAENEAALSYAADKRQHNLDLSKSKRKKAVKIALITFGSIIAVTAIILIINFVVIPNGMKAQYNNAEISLNEGRYNEAWDSFSDLGDYLESEDMLIVVAENAAKHSFDIGDFEEVNYWLGRLSDQYHKASLSSQEREVDDIVEVLDFISPYIGEKALAITLSPGFDGSFELQSNGDCAIEIPSDDFYVVAYPATYAEYAGVWEGRFNLFPLALDFVGFPGGEHWKFDGIFSKKTAVGSEYKEVQFSSDYGRKLLIKQQER